jgi:hypothetical protein
MGEYRCYLLDRAGAIRFVDVLMCEDDFDALSLAREKLEKRPHFHGFELWQGRRRVHVEETAEQAN